MKDRIDLLRGAQPPRPPAELRARVLGAARAAAALRDPGRLERWGWLRPQLGWIVAAAALLVAHALLDAAWPAAQRARVHAPRQARAAAEAVDIAGTGVTRGMVAELTRDEHRPPSVDAAALLAVL
jgi:hypothetical protein